MFNLLSQTKKTAEKKKKKKKKTRPPRSQGETQVVSLQQPNFHLVRENPSSLCKAQSWDLRRSFLLSFSSDLLESSQKSSQIEVFPEVNAQKITIKKRGHEKHKKKQKTTKGSNPNWADFPGGKSVFDGNFNPWVSNVNVNPITDPMRLSSKNFTAPRHTLVHRQHFIDRILGGQKTDRRKDRTQRMAAWLRRHRQTNGMFKCTYTEPKVERK